MKMAKATERDMEAALALCRALEALQEGHLPDEMTDPESEEVVWYDERIHAAKVVDFLRRLTGSTSLFRVCFGMTVLLDPENELVDPDARTLEAHPRFERIRNAAEIATNHLPWHEPTHPEYEGERSDAGRRLRNALWPEQYAAASE